MKYKYLKIIYNDERRKSIMRIFREVFILSLRNRRFAGYYFTSLLHKSWIDNCNDYLGTSEMCRLQEILCDQIAVDISHNKLFFHEYFGKRKLPMARLIAYNMGEKVFLEDKGEWNIYEITDSKSLKTIIEKMFHKCDSESIFMKPISGSCGKGARKLGRGTTEGAGDMLKDLEKEIRGGSFLFQEEVRQHKDLGKLNSTSLNTIRMDTFKFANAKAEIISAFLRIGLTGSHIDNIAAGGLFVGININEGTLKGKGFNKLAKGGFEYKAHPGTNVVFKDLLVPYFEEAKGLVLEAGNLLPGALIGWDIAISEHGPVLMEGNAIYYDMQLSDVAYGGYKKNPVFQRALDYVRVRNR